MRSQLFFCLSAIALLSNPALASSGDRANDFQRCAARCESQTCASDVVHTISFLDALTHWTCADQCKYQCMHTITDFAIETGVPVQQYYGKWPFWRFLGMQEPASVLFSLMNLLLHVWGRAEVQRDVPDGHPMKKYYIRWSYVSSNAWIWSAVLHTRG